MNIEQKLGFNWVGYEGKLERTTLFIIYKSASSLSEDQPQFSLQCNLPKFKKDLGIFGSVAKAQIEADRVFEIWLNRLGFAD